MEKHLKMSDVFWGAKPEDFHINPVCIHENFDDGVTPHNHVIHAINSHDELVAMNKELLNALEGMLKVSVMDVVSSDDFWRTFDRANELLAKAKASS